MTWTVNKAVSSTPENVRSMAIAALVLLGGAPGSHAKDACAWWLDHEAFESVTIERVQDCLEGGSDPNARVWSGEGPLFWASCHGRNQIVMALLELGASPNVRNILSATALHCAATGLAFVPFDDRQPSSESGEAVAAVIQALIAAGANPSARDESGSTPLHAASRSGKEAAVAALLEGGADPNVRNAAWGDDGDVFGGAETPLHLAVHGEHASVVVALLEGGADPNVVDGYDWTPLDVAISDEQFALITALLDGGADLSARDERGATALHRASRAGAVAVVAALLEGGADPGIRDEKGRVPFDMIPEDSDIIGTPVYWRLHDARWDYLSPAP